MKKFTKLLICLMLCVVSFGLIACGDDRTEKEKNFTYPTWADPVSSNGGLAVQKGNYVYFVNGYKSVSSITDKEASYTVGSLMLMKLGANGEIQTNDDGLLKDEYFIYMSGALCGYEATNLYIHGDYLYFVSPCLENEKGDEIWAKERVVFNRIKLDKTGEVEQVYSSGVKLDQLEYQYYEHNGALSILVWEKGESYYAENGKDTLIRVDALAKSYYKVANNVSSVVFADNFNEIFYVQYSEGDNVRYYLNQYNIASGVATNYTSFDKNFTVKFVANDKVYITIAHDYGSTTDIKASQISLKSGFELVYGGYDGSSDLFVTPDASAVVMVKSNIISLIKSANEVITINESSDVTAIKVIGFVNGCVVYYDKTSSNSNIKMVSYYNYINGGDTEIKTLATLNTFEEDYAYFDLSSDNGFMYFFNKEGENYYLNRLKVNNNLGETEEMFGVYESADVPEVEEETEEEE